MHRRSRTVVDDPLRPGPWVDDFYDIHPNTRRNRIKKGLIPPPDRWIGSPERARPYWFESTIRNAGANDAPRLVNPMPRGLPRGRSPVAESQ